MFNPGVQNGFEEQRIRWLHWRFYVGHEFARCNASHEQGEMALDGDFIKAEADVQSSSVGAKLRETLRFVSDEHLSLHFAIDIEMFGGEGEAEQVRIRSKRGFEVSSVSSSDRPGFWTQGSRRVRHRPAGFTQENGADEAVNQSTRRVFVVENAKPLFIQFNAEVIVTLVEVVHDGHHRINADQGHAVG